MFNLIKFYLSRPKDDTRQEAPEEPFVSTLKKEMAPLMEAAISYDNTSRLLKQADKYRFDSATIEILQQKKQEMAARLREAGVEVEPKTQDEEISDSIVESAEIAEVKVPKWEFRFRPSDNGRSCKKGFGDWQGNDPCIIPDAPFLIAEKRKFGNRTWKDKRIFPLDKVAKCVPLYVTHRELAEFKPPKRRDTRKSPSRRKKWKTKSRLKG